MPCRRPPLSKSWNGSPACSGWANSWTAAAARSARAKNSANLARALIHRPPVLLLDEPTLGLDILGTQVVVEFIAHVRAEGKAVILTTHHLDQAERLCDRFGLLHRGRLIQSGTLSDLRTSTGCANLVEMFLQLTQAGPVLNTAANGKLA